MSVQPTARHPRGAVLLKGVSVKVIEIEVENNAHFEADKATIDLVASELPEAADLAWLTSQRELDVEIKVGFPSDPDRFSTADLDTLFVGRADLVQFQADAGTVTLRCRDLTADLIDTNTSEQYRNLTASQLAERLAAEHGLTPVVTPTRLRIGSFYQIDQVRLQSRRSQWDLLTWAAREEDFTVQVRGRELYFGPRNDGANPYVVEWRPATETNPINATDFVRLGFERALNLATDIKVTVRSWNRRRGEAITRSAGSSVKEAKEYVYSIPDLTAAQVQARADQILAELLLHEMRVTFDGPADNTLQAGDVIEVRGTASTFDQLYYVDTVNRSLNESEGYRWTVEAKNRAREPQS